MVVVNTLALKELPHVTRDELAQVRSFVVHRQQHAFYVEGWIQRRHAHDASCRRDRPGPRVRSTSQCSGISYRICSDQCVEREEAQVTVGSR